MAVGAVVYPMLGWMNWRADWSLITAIQQAVDAKLQQQHITKADWTSLEAEPDGVTTNILGIPSTAAYWKQWITCGQNRVSFITESGSPAFFAFNSPADMIVPPQACT